MGPDTIRGRRLGVLLVTAALAVTACSSNGGSSNPPASVGGSVAPGATTAPGATVAAPTPVPVACAAPPVTGLSQIGGTVSILAVWTGSEQDSFMCMLKPFLDATGIQVQYQGDRNEPALLQTAIQGGSPPDVAGLPGPGVMQGFAKQGALKPLDTVIDLAKYKADSPAGFVDVGAYNGQQIGIFIKASVKGDIWFDPKVYTGGVPTSWDDLNTKAQAALTKLTGTKEWCVGLEAAAASGWPGTDWIEDFLLRQSGAAVYNGWPTGQTKWTSAEVKAAWQSYGKIVSPDAVYGGPTNVIATAFQDGGNKLFTTPPGCLFHHQASFITDFFVKQGGAKPGDYDFFPFPDIVPANNGVEGGGDLFGMFNDTPQAKALIQYLITPAAQDIWVKRGGAISASKSVSLSDYPDDIGKRSAQQLTNAKTFVFDASDLMSNAVNTAFFSGILEFTKDQTKLDSILTNLDSVQASGG